MLTKEKHPNEEAPIYSIQLLFGNNHALPPELTNQGYGIHSTKCQKKQQLSRPTDRNQAHGQVSTDVLELITSIVLDHSEIRAAC